MDQSSDSFATTFQRDGFVVVPELLTDAELDAFGRAVVSDVTPIAWPRANGDLPAPPPAPDPPLMGWPRRSVP